MLINELFGHAELCLPAPRPEGADVRDFLQAKFASYDALLTAPVAAPTDRVFDDVRALRPQIDSLAARILLSLDAHLSGKLDLSYQTMKGALEDVRSFLAVTNNQDVNRIDPIFRARSIDTPYETQDDELLHIPFDKRHRVGSQRYSIPGMPMLYLGSTSFGCWTELGRPPLDRLVANCWKPISPLNVLNLSYTPSNLSLFPAPTAGSNPALHQFLVAHAVIWPLVAALSIRTPRSERGFPFRVDYIVPQLLLRWVVEELGCDALRYFSTHLHAETDAQISANWVFPVKSNAKTGHCAALLGLFSRSAPLSWTLAHVSGVNQVGPVATGRIMVTDRVVANYPATAFATYDMALQALPRS